MFEGELRWWLYICWIQYLQPQRVKRQKFQLTLPSSKTTPLAKKHVFTIDFTFGPKFFPKRTLLANIWFANFSSRCLNRQFSCGKKIKHVKLRPGKFFGVTSKATSSIRILCWHISGIRLATRSVGWSGIEPIRVVTGLLAWGWQPKWPWFWLEVRSCFLEGWLSKIEVNLGCRNISLRLHGMSWGVKLPPVLRPQGCHQCFHRRGQDSFGYIYVYKNA